MKKTRFITLLFTLILLPSCAIAQFNQNSKSQLDVRRAVDIYRSVLVGANNYYVDTIDIQKVTQKGINAMLSQLDPYTEYFPEVERENFTMMTTGQYGGIGAYIQLVDSIVYVQDPMPRSPAERAGLQMGDAFLEINGESVVPGTPTLVSGKLRGPIGTTVKVLVKKLGKEKPMEVTITRDNVVVDQVVHSAIYRDSIGFIRLSSFTDKCFQDVQNAYNQLKATGKLKRLILDLRSNGGGVMDPAIDIVGMFVPKGTKVLYTEGRMPETSKEYFTEREPIAPDIPLVVLINGGSASASEIVSGALQDLDRAVLIGSKSFGKGLVQTTLPTPNDGMLKVTISRYFIPSGRCIQQLDYSHRNPDGSVAAVPDSLTKVFYTANGREVRDGGGIRPDIESEDETMSMLVYQLMNQGHIFEFSNKLYLERPNIAKLEDITITDEDYERFLTFLEEKDFKPSELSLKALEQLKELAEFEGYKEQSEAAFEALKKTLTPNLRKDLEASREQTKNMIKGMLAQHYFGAKGQYMVTIDQDPTVNKALDILQDNQQIKQILTKK